MTFSVSLGRHESDVRRAMDDARRQDIVRRLWAGDTSLWSADPAVQESIRNRLGWLSVTTAMRREAEALVAFGRAITTRGMTHIVLLGMGGSSLCPEVCRTVLGSAPGYPDLVVLDSTDPAAIVHVERAVDLRTTLFIVASKSGTTIEVQALWSYFMERLRAVDPGQEGRHAVAITDPGTSLAAQAREQKFERLFMNPADIGGRYSALSYFGLVPAVLLGVDLQVWLDRAQRMVDASGSAVPLERHPAARLGVVIGALAAAGRNKLTLCFPPELRSLGLWVEQLVAESTGKQGKGVVPVCEEEPGVPEVYGPDRLFAVVRTSASAGWQQPALDRLAEAGNPVLQIGLDDTLDLAGEFYRWELATAVAAAVMGVNPFDEPNVTESKANTSRMLGAHRKGEALSMPPLLTEEGDVRLYGAGLKLPVAGIGSMCWSFFRRVAATDYIAVLAYLEPNAAYERPLRQLLRLIRDRLHVAATLGYGPRYLHSTGQLHKGGPRSGHFLQIIADDCEDIEVPGAGYAFGLLKRAQALGDYTALADRRLPALVVHLPKASERALASLVRLLDIAE